MVAYGLPVIHQSLASAPLDIKEAIDWLIRIGGKDLNDSKKDRTGELLKAANSTLQHEIMPSVQSAARGIGDIESAVKSFVAQLASFIGYESRNGAVVQHHVNGSGVGRRTGHDILKDISMRGYLTCCKDDSSKCGPNCTCCQGGKAGDSRCSPRNCPIKALLHCSLAQTVLCGPGVPVPSPPGTRYKWCCVLSFLVICFVEDEELNNDSVKCKRCGDLTFHEYCHAMCRCVHKKAISKVACRINCLIQLAKTFDTLYINQAIPMCHTCRNCTLCNPPNQEYRCQPCGQCQNGEHCNNCIKGECCEQNLSRNDNCKKACLDCRTCSSVRSAVAFWEAMDRILYRCMECARCTGRSQRAQQDPCPTCTACSTGPCSEVCKNRKEFGKLIIELLQFMVYNFSHVTYAVTWKIAAIKDQCCQEKEKRALCNCTSSCCKDCKTNDNPCYECELYCLCCVDRGNLCRCSYGCANKLELILRPALSGYVSAYDYNSATWENLCKKANGDNKGKCSDQCNTECRCDTSDCPSEGCCTHCPKRKCAMIFCMVVPAIYRFFDYINHQIDAELGDGGGNATSQWASALINGDTHLGELLRTCGFPSDRLQPIMGCQLLDGNHTTINSSCRQRDHTPGNLKKLLESCEKISRSLIGALQLTDVYTPASTDCVRPTTVRDKLLWLCGLPYSDVYEELQQRLKDSMPNVSSSLPIMELTLRLCVFPFHCFEDGSQCIWEYITHGFAVPGSKQSLTYNKNMIHLLWDLYDTLYHVTCALTFMNIQCGISSQNCGWEECKFGKNVNVNGDADDTCKCQTGRCKGTCDHCTSVCNACRGKAKCVCCCPYCENRLDSCVCLARFIASNDTQGDHSSSFRNDRYGHMGYRMEFLRKAEMRGAMLYDCMSGLLIRDHTVFPRLLECLLIARAGVPENLSDYYALFLSMGMKFELESHHNGVPDKALTAVFKSSMANTFLGAHDGILEPVVIALRHLYNQDSRKYNGASMIHNEAATHNASDFMSLYGCYYGSGCVGYMNALSLAMYQVDSRYAYNGVTHSANLFPNWVLCGATKFYIGMRQLAEDVSALECCREPGTCTCESTHHHICICEARCNCACVKSGSNCNCRSITHCRFVHPLLYSSGITFHEPDTWSYPKRKCMDFSKTLNRIIGPDSMLCRLMEAIENFLWQIRLPFCIALLTLWATALCFLMYVFIGHLDTLGIRSRWLLPRQLAHPLQLVMNTKVKPMGSGVGVI